MTVNTLVDERISQFVEISDYINSISISHETFVSLVANYDINEIFALATFKWETGNGTSAVWINNNNPAGIRCGIEYCSYKSQKEGIKAMLDLLQKYINEYNLKTVNEIRALWSESNDSEQIVTIMKEIVRGG